MPHNRCPVGICINDSLYVERMEIHSNVKNGHIKFHKAPVKRVEEWKNAVLKSRKNLQFGN